MKTEAEAKELWCPHVRHAEIIDRVFFSDGKERLAATNNGTTCVASHCMMWRWEDLPLHNQQMKEKPTKGYCGLGGKP